MSPVILCYILSECWAKGYFVRGFGQHFAHFRLENRMRSHALSPLEIKSYREFSGQFGTDSSP